jgi:ABC-type dipeptide/oligopeptide/nickel transport system permease component
VGAVQGQDYQIVQGGCLVIGGMIVLTNLMVDVSYGWLDPRIRYG